MVLSMATRAAPLYISSFAKSSSGCLWVQLLQGCPLYQLGAQRTACKTKEQISDPVCGLGRWIFCDSHGPPNGLHVLTGPNTLKHPDFTLSFTPSPGRSLRSRTRLWASHPRRFSPAPLDGAVDEWKPQRRTQRTPSPPSPTWRVSPRRCLVLTDLKETQKPKQVLLEIQMRSRVNFGIPTCSKVACLMWAHI